jgi:hypothetical protein
MGPTVIPEVAVSASSGDISLTTWIRETVAVMILCFN